MTLTYTQRKSKKQHDNTNTPPKTSITEVLRTDLGRSVGVKSATPLLWLNRMFYSEGDTTFKKASRTGLRQGMLGIVIEEILWPIRWSYQTIWSSSLTNVKWCSLTKYNENPPPIRLYANLWPFYQTRPVTKLWEVFIEDLQWVWHAHRGRLLLRPAVPVTFGTCICSTFWDQFYSRTCCCFLPDFAFRTSLLTFPILPLNYKRPYVFC